VLDSSQHLTTSVWSAIRKLGNCYFVSVCELCARFRRINRFENCQSGRRPIGRLFSNRSMNPRARRLAVCEECASPASQGGKSLRLAPSGRKLDYCSQGRFAQPVRPLLGSGPVGFSRVRTEVFLDKLLSPRQSVPYAHMHDCRRLCFGTRSIPARSDLAKWTMN
jgi:hypothetical protein